MPRSPFLDALSRHMLAHHYGQRTIDSYLYWIRFFIRFHNKTHPQEMGATEVKDFLAFLANDRRVSVSTQKACLNRDVSKL
ncbi:MAG TPA: site-specific integrase [Pseudomonadales bacterium]